MPITNQRKNQHLLWRAGFGPMAENVGSLETISQKSLWNLLLKTSAAQPKKLEVVNGLGDGLMNGIKGLSDLQKRMQDKAVKQKMKDDSREQLKNLNVLWLDELIHSNAQLREKMSFFWHGHFACRVINSFFQQELLDVIRMNALGNFGGLLKAVSKCPSMLQFLNNQQNKKDSPNENFAREVMELFTMGRGNYTETDVKEAARAFTGWGFNLKGEFAFRKFVHDNGQKTFLGKTGNFDGDDILNILLEQKTTARFIAEKVYKFFVNENPEKEKLDYLSLRFYESNYNIQDLMETIFTSDWFYSEKNIGNRIKSPIELLAGIRRYLPMEMDDDASQLVIQKVLGQILFYPPNVAGWAGGRSWIDSSTLMIRLQLPQIVAAKETLTLSPKVDDDVAMGMQREEMQKRINKAKGYDKKGSSSVIDWKLIENNFMKVPREQLAQKLTDSLWQTGGKVNEALLGKYVDASSKENYIRSAVINLMSTPEYQLC